jgi:hypothetical protein
MFYNTYGGGYCVGAADTSARVTSVATIHWRRWPKSKAPSKAACTVENLALSVQLVCDAATSQRKGSAGELRCGEVFILFHEPKIHADRRDCHPSVAERSGGVESAAGLPAIRKAHEQVSAAVCETSCPRNPTFRRRKYPGQVRDQVGLAELPGHPASRCSHRN